MREMISFQDPSNRLSGRDIKTILQNCRLCFKTISNGKYIMTPTDVQSLLLPNSKKHAIILNTHDHWLCLLIFRNRYCLVVDSINEVQNWPEVMKNIIIFSKNNKLKLYSFNLKTQSSKTQICGMQCNYFIFKFTTLSFLGFFKLRTSLLKNCISTNERAIVRSARRHFKLNWFFSVSELSNYDLPFCK